MVFHSWGDDPAYTESYLREYIAINPFFPAMSFVSRAWCSAAAT